MKNIEILLVVLFTIINFTSCETEEEKAFRLLGEEAKKVVLTQEEFATLKEYSKNSYYTIPIDESKIVSDDEVEGNEACATLNLNDLLELYQIGKKRDWLVEHGFEINYYFYLFQHRDMEYEDIINSHFIGYGRCYYTNAVRRRRVGLRVTHVKHQLVEYETTFKNNMEEIEADLIGRGAKKVSGDQEDKSYEYLGIPITIHQRKGSKDRLTGYVVSLNSTYNFNPIDYASPEEIKELEKLIK